MKSKIKVKNEGEEKRGREKFGGKTRMVVEKKRECCGDQLRNIPKEAGRSALSINRLAWRGASWRETSANDSPLLYLFLASSLPPSFSFARLSFPHLPVGFLRRNAKHLHSRGRPPHRCLACIAYTFCVVDAYL